MAVDEWLAETVESPLLRAYRWCGEWGSLGYFGRIAEAEAAFPGLAWVRRWTGGGVVDHRADWTYTLVDPAGGPLFLEKGDASYRRIHAGLAAALGEEVSLQDGAGDPGIATCFQNPVRHDLVDRATRRKIAGAGQRRTKRALLHQGSVDLPEGTDPAEMAARFASAIASAVRPLDLAPPAGEVTERAACRYADPRWTRRR